MSNTRIQSYTSMSAYKCCPKKYELMYVQKVEKLSSDALNRGRTFHDNVENGKVTKSIKEFYEQHVGTLKRVRGVPNFFMRDKSKEFVFKVKEFSFGITREGLVEDYSDDDGLMFRGKIDELIYKLDPRDLHKAFEEGSIDSFVTDAQIVEWKTGKNCDKEQVKMYALGVFLKFPNVETLDTKILFTSTKKVRSYTFKREEIVVPVFQDIVKRIHEIEESVVFPYVTNFSCPYCAVRNACPKMSKEDATFDSLMAQMGVMGGTV